MPQLTVSQQPVTSQPKQDPEDIKFQMAILQSQLLDMNRKIDQMNRNQNHPVEPVILNSVSGMCTRF